MRPRKYTIVTAMSIAGLEEQVNYKVDYGWQPVGGIMQDSCGYYQAMVKYG